MTRTTAALSAACLALCLFLASLKEVRFTSATPDNFYGMQTEAFLKGRLSLTLVPNPALATLANPYEGAQNLPYRIQDLSYYQGRYYSYFGVGPIVYLLLPWRVLTGTYLRDQGATVVLEIATTLAALLLLLRLRRHFPSLGSGGLLCAYLLVTLGSWQALHVPPYNAGTIAQASAYLWLTLGLVCLDMALETARDRWIAGVSLCVGLMLASRPSFLPSVLLFVPLLLRGQGRRGGAWTAALVPMGVIIAGLLAYNEARFHSVFEFGVRLQLVDHDYRHVPLLTAAYLGQHLLPFLTQAPHPLPEFPFLETGDRDPIGLLWACPAVILVIPGLFRFRSRKNPSGGLFMGIVLTSCGLLIFLAAYRFYLFHYSVDFFVAFAWAAVLGWFMALEDARTPAGRRLLLVCGWVLVSVGVLEASVFALKQSGKARWLASAANSAAYRIECMAGLSYGPVRIHFTLAGAQPGKNYPLLSASHHNLETCYLRILPDNRAQLGILQTALGPLSAPFAFEPGRPHVVEIRMGSLLPPAPHPLYEHWTEAQQQQATRLLEVTLDGKTIILRHGESLGSEVGKIALGQDTIHRGRIEARFPGSISMEHLPFIPAEWTGRAFPDGGPGVALTFKLDPAVPMAENQPLLSAGLGQGATVVYLRTPDPEHAVFGIDGLGYGGKESARLRFNRLAPHRLEVYPASPNQTGPRVIVDGEAVVLGLEPPLPIDPAVTFFGANAARSSAVQPSFSGSITEIRRLAWPAKFAFAPRTGVVVSGLAPVSFDTELDDSAGETGQPLLVSGHTGAADILYLRVTGPGSVVVGHDHWGVGEVHSDPISIDPTTIMHWRVELRQHHGCRIWLNGTLVLESGYAPFPVSQGAVRVGANRAGGSTCGAEFSGRVLGVTER